MPSRTPTTAFSPPSANLIARLAAIVGSDHALTSAGTQAPYLREWRDRYTGRTPLVLRPGSTEEVSRILALAHEHAVAIVPQAGNTGLVGGQIPSESGNEIVVSVDRLRTVRHIDPGGGHVILEAGVTLAEARELAHRADRLFPLSMASEGSCRIGGNLATNAGGIAVLAYGSARNLVLGLEVVLAGGRIWDGLRTLKKDNTGYDLRDLFIGSEGTLGVITAAALKLFPKPWETATALVAVSQLPELARLFRRAEVTAGPALTAFEFMGRTPLEFVVRHLPDHRAPFPLNAPWYALLELSSHRAGKSAQAALERLLGDGEAPALDTAIALSLTQARDLWRLREGLSEAQKHEGGSIKHDVSVPVPSIPEFLARADERVERVCPGARPVTFGHWGDGNVHYNVSQPPAMEKARFLGLWEPMTEAIHSLVAGMGGSISAEHGIGQMKRDELRRYKSGVELDLMRAIKTALDPKGILNPGKVL